MDNEFVQLKHEDYNHHYLQLLIDIIIYFLIFLVLVFLLTNT